PARTPTAPGSATPNRWPGARRSYEHLRLRAGGELADDLCDSIRLRLHTVGERSELTTADVGDPAEDDRAAHAVPLEDLVDVLAGELVHVDADERAAARAQSIQGLPRRHALRDRGDEALRELCPRMREDAVGVAAVDDVT